MDSMKNIGNARPVICGDAGVKAKYVTWDDSDTANVYGHSLFEIIGESYQRESEELDRQLKRELDKIKFRGEITPKKVKRHGFQLVSQQNVGTYITKNGVRVTDIFFKPFAPELFCK